MSCLHQPSLFTGGNDWHFTQFIIIHEMLMSNTMPACVTKTNKIKNYKKTELYHEILLVKKIYNKSREFDLFEFHNYRRATLSEVHAMTTETLEKIDSGRVMNVRNVIFFLNFCTNSPKRQGKYYRNPL